jgi:hypothetical protein
MQTCFTGQKTMRDTDAPHRTDPATLRAVADTLAPKGGAEDVFIAVLTLRAIAAEKEAQAAPAGDLVETVALAIGRAYGTTAAPLGAAYAALSAITAAGYEIRPRGEATPEPDGYLTSWHKRQVGAEWHYTEKPRKDWRDVGLDVKPFWFAPPKATHSPGEDLGGGMVAVPAGTVNDLIAAVQPFRSAWDRAITAVGDATLGEIGAIAKHHVAAVDIKRLSEALAALRSEQSEPKEHPHD